MDFDRWLNREEQSAKDRQKAAALAAHIENLEDADVLVVMKDGRYMVRCCVCEKDDELPVGPDEIDCDYVHYCGGSPRCCP